MNMTSQTAFGPELKITAYDRVAGMLVALLVVVGIAVLLMFTVWMTAELAWDKPPSTVIGHAYAIGSTEKTGLDGEMEEPGAEDLEAVREPSIEATLTAVSNVVASRAGGFDALEGQALGGVGGVPKGRRRVPGRKDIPIPNVVPPWLRWEIRFTTTDIVTYARQLDFFGIDLGVVGGGSAHVEYARNLTKPKPDRASALPENEKRLYMTWQDGGGTMGDMDRRLLARAGIAADRRIVLQFYPAEVQKQLLILEAMGAGERTPSELLKTVFGVRPAGDGFEFYVVEQSYRPRPATSP
jgi:hypothetical protein